jgi:hypothetical protein
MARRGPLPGQEADVTGAEPPDGTVQDEEQPELPPKLAAVLGNLEEAAAAHDDEFADVLSRITPLPADEDEAPA